MFRFPVPQKVGALWHAPRSQNLLALFVIWPVDLKTCKTDDMGNPVHEDCYMLRELLKTATQPKMEQQA